MIRKRLITIIAGTMMVAMIQTAQAAWSGTLLDLTGPNSTGLTIGDKTFSGFSFTTSGLTGFDPSAITVTASYDGNGVYFLTYGGNISLVSGGPATADLKLNYTVTVSPSFPDNYITMIDQKYTGSATGGFLSIDETATSGAPTAHSHLDAVLPDRSDPNVYPNGSPFDVGENDVLLINPAQKTLNVTKDIAFGISANSGGFITVSEVQQSFHVPEPTTMIAGALLLLPFGASTLRMLRKNRSA